MYQYVGDTPQLELVERVIDADSNLKRLEIEGSDNYSAANLFVMAGMKKIDVHTRVMTVPPTSRVHSQEQIKLETREGVWSVQGLHLGY